MINSEKKITSLRGALENINWVAGMSRPEISMFVRLAPESKTQHSQTYLPLTKSSNLLSQHQAASPFQ